jgi:hypothetical protein
MNHNRPSGPPSKRTERWILLGSVVAGLILIGLTSVYADPPPDVCYQKFSCWMFARVCWDHCNNPQGSCGLQVEYYPLQSIVLEVSPGTQDSKVNYTGWGDVQDCYRWRPCKKSLADCEEEPGDPNFKQCMDDNQASWQYQTSWVNHILVEDCSVY